MAIEIIIPDNEDHWLDLRTQDITSTEVAALFGLSPYMTAFELWHRKKNKELVDPFEGNKFTKWGNRLEAVIAEGIAEDENWSIRKMDEYIRDTELRMGASFDYAYGFHGEERGILEIKNVFGMIFQDQWITEDKRVEAPPHIELQVQAQLSLSGKPEAHIGALISGNKIELMKRKPDLEIIAEIKKRIKDFWQSIDENKEPTPNFVKDAEFIAKLYMYAEPNKIKDARDDKEIIDLAQKYKAASAVEKGANSLKKSLKSQLLMLIDESEKCIGEDFTISAGMIAPTDIESYTKKGYRNFRIFWRKKKK